MVICDFCDKTQEEVFRMILGNGGAAICNECSLLATQIVIEQLAEDTRAEDDIDENTIQR